MNDKNNQTVIIDCVRSAIGTKNGKLIGIRPDDLTAQVIKTLLKRNPHFPIERTDDVILGCAFPEAGQGMLMARAVADLAGIPMETGAKVVNRFCGSSMDAVHQLDRAIMVGDIEAGLAVGVEDMFSIPMGGFNPSFHPELVKKNFYIGMGETAENLAKQGNISREEQEAFAVQSHRKAIDAWKNGRFDNEVVPISFNGTIIEQDEGPREPDIEKIRALRPAFLKAGTITAATSSPSLGYVQIAAPPERLDTLCAGRPTHHARTAGSRQGEAASHSHPRQLAMEGATASPLILRTPEAPHMPLRTRWPLRCPQRFPDALTQRTLLHKGRYCGIGRFTPAAR